MSKYKTWKEANLDDLHTGSLSFDILLADLTAMAYDAGYHDGADESYKQNTKNLQAALKF